jgi:hypothetical protein
MKPVHIRKSHLGGAVHVAVSALHGVPVRNLVLATAAAGAFASSAVGALDRLGAKLGGDETREVAVSSFDG